jgi:hypothetical protein
MLKLKLRFQKHHMTQNQLLLLDACFSQMAACESLGGSMVYIRNWTHSISCVMHPPFQDAVHTNPCLHVITFHSPYSTLKFGCGASSAPNAAAILRAQHEARKHTAANRAQLMQRKLAHPHRTSIPTVTSHWAAGVTTELAVAAGTAQQTSPVSRQHFRKVLGKERGCLDTRLCILWNATHSCCLITTLDLPSTHVSTIDMFPCFS